MEGHWEAAAQKTFESLLSAVPGPLKELAGKRVLARIREIVKAGELNRVGVRQVVEAFRRETPGMYRPQVEAQVKALGLEGYWQNHE